MPNRFGVVSRSMQNVLSSGGRFERSHRDDVREHLDRLCDAQPFRTAWSVTELSSGIRISRDGGRVVPSASTRKVAIMMSVLRAVTDGELELNRPVAIDHRYRDQVFTGLTQHLSVGLKVTVLDALTLMIAVSDNLTTAHLVDLIGLDAVNEFCTAIGMTGTVQRHALIPALPRDHPADATNATTADDQEWLIRSILNGSCDSESAARLGCTVELCRLAIDLLRHQKFADAVPALLPDGTTVAHKTGAGWHDMNDVGIVFRDGEPFFSIAVFTDAVPVAVSDGTPGRDVARRHIATIARHCWDAFGPQPSPSGSREEAR